MPIYEYRCRKCGEVTEVIQKFSDKPKRKRSEREDEKEIEGVFIIDDEDQARFVPVETGIADELSIEVTGDLEEGQKVVSGPYKVLRKLKNGEDLKVEEEEEQSSEETEE